MSDLEETVKGLRKELTQSYEYKTGFAEGKEYGESRVLNILLGIDRQLYGMIVHIMQKEQKDEPNG